MRENRKIFERAIDRPRRVRQWPRVLSWIVSVGCGVYLALPGRAHPIRQALGMVESGNDDHAVGRAGEISRYQIKKDIWRAHSSSSKFWDENEAWRITRIVLDARIEAYRRHTGHGPTPFDIYVLWNAPGQFQRVGYSPRRISPVIAERAARFENLVRKFESTTSVTQSPAAARLLGLQRQRTDQVERPEPFRAGKVPRPLSS